MTEGSPLDYYEGLWGADEVITDYQADGDDFRATLIQKAVTEELLERKRTEVLKCLKNTR